MLLDPEQTPTYQRLVQKGFAEGFAEGLLLGTRKSLITIVQAHFPSLRSLAERQAEQVTDLETLRQASLQISEVPTVEAARQYLLELSNPRA